MVQNHVMELLSFVAMEPPSSFEAEAVRARKGEGLAGDSSRFRSSNAVRGQYGPGMVDGKKVVGYREEERVNPRVAAPRPTPRCGWRSKTGAGRACRSICARASG